MKDFMKIFQNRESSMVLGLFVIICFIIFSGSENREIFFSAANIENLTRQIALLGIFAIGETIVIISGGIDLSVGSIIAFSGVFASYLMSSPYKNGFEGPGLDSYIAILLTLIISTIIGFLNGFLISKIGLPPFVATLGTMSILRGIAKLMTGSLTISTTDSFFNSLGNNKINIGLNYHIPIPLIILIVIFIIIIFIMNKTTFGKYFYAIGSNETATRFSGIKVDKIKILSYTICGILSGIAGIVYASYNRLGDPGGGVGYELNAIASAVIGGCNLSGGEGSILGTIIGTSILCVILNGLNLVIKRNASLWEGVIVGSVVIAAVVLNILREKKEN